LAAGAANKKLLPIDVEKAHRCYACNASLSSEEGAT
jgi:hypothetical protein